ncbi:MAG: hypothetical protein LBB47_02060 [Spirochaetaceae bacterium]|nr:hypothetical protein [Spirochaetaceae bacterium]
MELTEEDIAWMTEYLSGLQTWRMGVNKASGRTITIDGGTIYGSACQGGMGRIQSVRG